MTEETLFPLEQILTVSARDYIDYFRESFSSNSADPCHYDFVGVHNQFYLSRSDSLKATSILKNFQKKVPSNTESHQRQLIFWHP